MAPSGLVRPALLSVDRCGQTIVADVLGSRLLAFDRRGQVRGQWVLDGRRSGEFGRVTGLAASPEGTTVVAGSGSLHWYDPGGAVIGVTTVSRPADDAPVRPGPVAVDERAAVYLIDLVSQRVIKVWPA
jgi:hypothetical protein